MERQEKTENTDTIRPQNIETDPELRALATRLTASAPQIQGNPAFRMALRDRLLDILAEHQVSQGEKGDLGQMENNTETIYTRQDFGRSD